VCSIRTAWSAFAFNPSSLAIVGAIEVVSTVEALTSPSPIPASETISGTARGC